MDLGRRGLLEGLYYLCSKNKGADQLQGYHATDLCLCFRNRFSHGAVMRQNYLYHLAQSDSECKLRC